MLLHKLHVLRLHSAKPQPCSLHLMVSLVQVLKFAIIVIIFLQPCKFYVVVLILKAKNASFFCHILEMSTLLIMIQSFRLTCFVFSPGSTNKNFDYTCPMQVFVETIQSRNWVYRKSSDCCSGIFSYLFGNGLSCLPYLFKLWTPIWKENVLDEFLEVWYFLLL